MTDNNLPYSFDLLFDLKSREDLVRHYANLKQEIGQIDEVMSSHNIEFTIDELAVISPDDTKFDESAARKPY
jgi:hypothetical protein